jgi:hypothetical protein
VTAAAAAAAAADIRPCLSDHTPVPAVAAAADQAPQTLEVLAAAGKLAPAVMKPSSRQEELAWVWWLLWLSLASCLAGGPIPATQVLVHPHCVVIKVDGKTHVLWLPKGQAKKKMERASCRRVGGHWKDGELDRR